MYTSIIQHDIYIYSMIYIYDTSASAGMSEILGFRACHSVFNKNVNNVIMYISICINCYIVN